MALELATRVCHRQFLCDTYREYPPDEDDWPFGSSHSVWLERCCSIFADDVPTCIERLLDLFVVWRILCERDGDYCDSHEQCNAWARGDLACTFHRGMRMLSIPEACDGEPSAIGTRDCSCPPAEVDDR